LLPQIKKKKIATIHNVPNAEELMVSVLTAQSYSEIMVNIEIIPGCLRGKFTHYFYYKINGMYIYCPTVDNES